MKTELLKAYICDHCKRKMWGAGAMARHEKWCKQNPSNQHKCFDFCEHLKMEHKMIEVNCEPYRITEMTCTKLNKNLYSYKLEKKNKPYLLINMERMPLECKDHEYMDSYIKPKN